MNHVRNFWPQVTKDLRYRRFIWTVRGDRPGNDDEEVGNEAEQGDTDDGRCDNPADSPKVPGKCTAEKQ